MLRLAPCIAVAVVAAEVEVPAVDAGSMGGAVMVTAGGGAVRVGAV